MRSSKRRSLLRDLRELARIEPNADASQRAIERARAAVLETAALPGVQIPYPKRIMSVRNLVAVFAALTAIFVLTHLLAPAGTSGGFAFAEVQEQVGKTKSVQYIETRTNSLPNGQKLDGMIRRVKILGPYRMREELTETPGEVLSNRPYTDSYVQIHDAKKGILVTLYPDRKSHEVVERILGITADGKVVESKPEPNPQIDFYAQIREVPSDKAVKLNDKFIGDKVVKGFQVETKRETAAGTDTLTKTYWVDPSTKLPVQIESSLRSTSPNRAESDWLRTDFIFDEPMDEALFSTDKPDGYR